MYPDAAWQRPDPHFQNLAHSKAAHHRNFSLRREGMFLVSESPRQWLLLQIGYLRIGTLAEYGLMSFNLKCVSFSHSCVSSPCTVVGGVDCGHDWKIAHAACDHRVCGVGGSSAIITSLGHYRLRGLAGEQQLHDQVHCLSRKFSQPLHTGFLPVEAPTSAGRPC